jgi:argininosuccinate lyase
MNEHLWTGRLSDRLDAEFAQFQASLRFDHRLAKYDIEASIAHAQMMRAQGIVNPQEGDQILRALREIATDRADEINDISQAGEDIHTVVETLLKEKIGNLAGKLHTARSRNDQVATDLRLFIKDACQSHRDSIRGFAQAIAEPSRATSDVTLWVSRYFSWIHSSPDCPAPASFSLVHVIF